MNKNQHRIVFNARRGMRMAVAETAASQGKCASGEGGPASMGSGAADAGRALFALAAGASLVLLSGLLAAPVHGQIVADPMAPGRQQATVLQTANGLPQVNIQTPSAAGVSRNTYRQFDVGSNGVILNNSRTDVSTQLGGYVQGNPWLATGSARVILNEVNSSSASQLRGFIEVAGQRAEVIIANPAGIAVNGGGFLNASAVTLTTGAPVMNSGSLDRFQVRGGTVTVDGAGLDTSTADFTNILARAVQVNAGIWAKDLKVVTGANDISAASSAAPVVTTTTTGAGAAPAFALDVSALGGMYAGKIWLVGTEAGLGVRNGGVIGASAGDVVLNNNGWLSSSGSIYASANLSASTQGDISNSGSLYAAGDTHVHSNAATRNTGVIAAQGNTRITTQSLDSSHTSVLAAGLQADGSLSPTAASSLEVTTSAATAALGQNVASQNLAINAASVDLMQSTTRAANIAITAANGDISTRGAALTAPGTVSMQARAGTLDNSQGVISAGAALALQARQISNAAGSEISGQSVTLQASDTIDNRGLIDSVSTEGSSTTRIDAATLNNTGTGRIYGDTVALGVGTLNNTAETLAGQTQAGTIAARGRMAIGAGTVNNTGGAQILSLGDLAIGGALDAQANATGSAALISNEASTIEAAGNMQLTAARLQNIRPNVQITQVVTTDETVQLGRPSYWGGVTFGTHYQNIYYNGYDNYYLSPSAILRQLPDVYSADGFLYHRVEVALSASDSVFVQSWSATDDYQSYAYDRKAVATGTKILYYTSRDDSAKNPDFYPETIPANGGGAVVHVASADPTHFGQCQSNCIHIVTPQDYNNLNQFMSYDNTVGSYIQYGERAGDWEGRRVAHHVTTTDTLNANAGAASVIRSGGAMVIEASTRLDNQYSAITAGGALQINGQSHLTDTAAVAASVPAVNNVGQLLYNTDTFTNTSYARTGYSKGSWSRPTVSQLVGDVRGTIAGDQSVSIQGNVSNLNSGITPGNLATSGQGGSATTGLSLPNSSLYKTNTGPGSHYLVETDPRFTNYKSWLGSDYISTKVSLDPTVTQKRLGDGFYEQQLVREQVAALTGKRFLGNYQSDDQQYQALMDAGIAYAQQFNLREGVALSAEQMALLTSPMVWLVEESLQMPDGSTQKVLTPKVYASKNVSLQASGALIMGDSVAINQRGNATTEVLNQGAIQANKRLDINALNIENQGGTLRGQDLGLQAAQDVVNTGGKVQAQSSLNVIAGRDIVAQTTTASAQSGGLAIQDLRQTTVQQVASFEAGGSGANSNLNLQAGRDLSLNAAQVSNAGTGTTRISADRDVKLGSVTTSSSLDSVRDGQNYTRTSQSSEVGTSIQGAGNVSIHAGRDLTARAVEVHAGQDTTLTAGNNIRLQAGQSILTLDSQRHSSESDGISSKTSDTQTQASSAAAQASRISGRNVSVQADNDLLSVGTAFKAQESMDVGGANHTLLYATQDKSQSTTTTHSSSGVAGIGLEDKTTTDSMLQSTSMGTQLIATQRVQIGVAEQADLQGAQVEGQTIAFVQTSPHGAGELILGGSTNATQTSHTEKNETAGVWQEQKGNGATVQTLNQTSLKGNVTFDAGLKISAQIPDSKGGQQLKTQLQALAQQGNGLDYLNQLAINPNVQWDKVALANEHWSYDQAGLTPAGAALLSIAVAAYTGGMGVQALGGTGSTLGGAALTTTTATGAITTTALGTAVNAGFASLASQAAVAMVNNGGDIGKTLNQLGSEQSVKGLLTTMVTAGGLDALGSSAMFNGQSGAAAAGPNSLSAAQTAGTFGDKLLKNVTNNVAGAAIDSAINGKPFDEKSLATALTSALITSGIAYGANEIGAAKLDNFISNVAHAALGCVGGAAIAGKSGGCSAGAAGAVVGELSANYALNSGMSDTQAAALAQILSATAGLLAGGGGDNVAAVNVAHTTGANAADNNRMLHKTEAQKAAQLATQSGGKHTRAQIEDAMRNSGNAQFNEDINSNTQIPNTDTRKPMDPGAQFQLGGDGKTLVQVQPNGGKVDPALAAYIFANTGGANSPYSWMDVQTGKVTPLAASTASNTLGPGWNYMGSNSAGVASGVSTDNRAQSEIDASLKRTTTGIATAPLWVPVVGAAAFYGTSALTGMGIAAQSVPISGGLAGLEVGKIATTATVGAGFGSAINYLIDPNSSPASLLISGVSGAIGGSIKLSANAAAGLANQWIPTNAANFTTQVLGTSIGKIINISTSDAVKRENFQSWWTSPISSCGMPPRKPC